MKNRKKEKKSSQIWMFELETQRWSLVKKGEDVCKMRKMVFCVNEKERDKAEDLVFAMVLCVSDPETEEKAKEVWERERRSSEEVWERERRLRKDLKKTKKKLKRFEKEREVWKRWYCVWETESENKMCEIDFFFLIFKILRRGHVVIFSYYRKKILNVNGSERLKYWRNCNLLVHNCI